MGSRRTYNTQTQKYQQCRKVNSKDGVGEHCNCCTFIVWLSKLTVFGTVIETDALLASVRMWINSRGGKDLVVGNSGFIFVSFCKMKSCQLEMQVTSVVAS